MLKISESKPTRLERSQSTGLPHDRHITSSIGRSHSYGPQIIRSDTMAPSDVESLHETVETVVFSAFKVKKLSWFCVGALFIACTSGYIARQTIHNTAATVTIMEESRLLLRDKVAIVANDLLELKKQINSINMKNQPSDLNPDKQEMKVSNIRAMHQMNKAQKRVDEASKQALILKERIQSLSLRGILQKYGDRVHFVEFELDFQNGKDGPTTFVLELAPNELMPHSVETFLDMVSNNLIDGCSFIMNALNLIKAAPVPYNGSSARDKAQSFTNFSLDTLAFKEYSDSFPHEKYTMGFTADGSPSFFINVEDNTESHEGDPCFGKVIRGFDTIQRLESSPTRNGIWFTQRVGIKSARIIEESSIRDQQSNLRHSSRS